MSTKPDKKIAETNRGAEQRAPDQDAAVEAAFVEGTLPDADRRAAEDAADLAEMAAVEATGEAPIPWVAPVEAAMEPVAAAVPDSLHALDSAPVNSKIVVVDTGAIMATPDFEIRLPDGDPAHALPIGARIIKRADGIYQSVQLSPAEDRPLLITATAADAIARFVVHFHE
jgi:hypothetical protein